MKGGVEQSDPQQPTQEGEIVSDAVALQHAPKREHEAQEQDGEGVEETQQIDQAEDAHGEEQEFRVIDGGGVGKSQVGQLLELKEVVEAPELFHRFYYIICLPVGINHCSKIISGGP